MYMSTSPQPPIGATIADKPLEWKDALGNHLKAGDRVVFATGNSGGAANLTEGVIVKLYEFKGYYSKPTPKIKVRRVNVNGVNVDDSNKGTKYFKKAEYISLDKIDQRVAKLS